jgi:hypothetical protein
LTLREGSWGTAMDYLVVKLFWYLAAAFAIGVVVGWISCGRVED